MSIFIPREKTFWQRRPTAKQEVNRSHWAGGLAHSAAVFCGDSYDSATSEILSDADVVYEQNHAIFDGDTSRILVDSYNHTDVVSIISRIATFDAAKTNRAIFSKYDGSSSDNDSFMLRQDATSMQMFVRKSGGTSWASASVSGLVQNIASDVAGVFDGNDVYSYLDGISAGASYSGSMRANSGAANYIGVHSNRQANQGFEGSIEYLHVFHAGFDADQVASLHENPYQILKPRRSYWLMPSGSGGTTDDLLADSAESSSAATSPALGQIHNLSADSIESSGEASSPVINQIHALHPNFVESSSGVSSPSLADVPSGVTPLLADDVESSSEAASPALGQLHSLNGSGVESGVEISTPALGVVVNLFADDVQSGSEVSAPALEIAAAAITADDAESTGEVSVPAIAQVHVLYANNINSAADVGIPRLNYEPPVKTPVATAPPKFKSRDWAGLVKAADGNKPKRHAAYRFSGGRTFYERD